MKNRFSHKPGSAEALKIGCLCAVMDNNHGLYAPYPPDGWWITAKCPLHGQEAKDAGKEAWVDRAGGNQR